MAISYKRFKRWYETSESNNEIEKKNQFPTFIDVESAEGDISKVSPFVLQNKE